MAFITKLSGAFPSLVSVARNCESAQTPLNDLRRVRHCPWICFVFACVGTCVPAFPTQRVPRIAWHCIGNQTNKLISLFWQQIMEARMEYWYRKVAGFPHTVNLAKKEAMEGLTKVRNAGVCAAAPVLVCLVFRLHLPATLASRGYVLFLLFCVCVVG